MFRLTTYPDATPGKDDLVNYVSSRASATIAVATQFIFGIDYATGDIDDQEERRKIHELTDVLTDAANAGEVAK